MDYELFEVPNRWLFLKITTSDGTVGWGEPVVEGRAKTVRGAVEELMDNYLPGEDPGRIEHHWQRLYRSGPYEPMFVEDPALAEHNDALPEIAQHTTTSIATGERMYSRWDYKELLNRASSICRPIPDSESRSTRRWYVNDLSRSSTGTTRSGNTTMAALPSGGYAG